jgi:hypothetical protein
MRYIDTLEKLRLYLSSKETLDIEEKALLGQIRDDLNYFPTGTIHRDSLIEFGYEAHLVDDAVLATLGSEIDEDCWSQMSGEQVPILADKNDIPYAGCPLCDEIPRFENGNWYCENVDCQREWSYMKYVWIPYSDDTAFLFSYDIGFISHSTRSKKMSLFLPVDLYRMHFGKSPDRDNIYQIFFIEDPDDLQQLTSQGYTLEKVSDAKGLEKFGKRAYWMTCFTSNQ